MISNGPVYTVLEPDIALQEAPPHACTNAPSVTRSNRNAVPPKRMVDDAISNQTCSPSCAHPYTRHTRRCSPTPVVNAELGSGCHSARAILIGILQNRQEMQFSATDRAPEGGYGGELERWGHPQNFAGSSIEGEQKFWGWQLKGSVCEGVRW